jgi:CheY-like chemotaxis protein
LCAVRVVSERPKRPWVLNPFCAPFGRHRVEASAGARIIMRGEEGPHARLRLLIVNGDEQKGRALEAAARATDRFDPIERMGDGRFALEHVWDCILNRPGDMPDVVITDLRVGGLGGVQLTRELRRYAETQKMLIAFIASGAGPLDQDAAETAGADYFVSWPKSDADSRTTLLKIAERSCALGPLPVRMLN